MDRASVIALRELLATTGWVERSRTFARSLRRSVREPGTLLLVGTPAEEPWHLAAHLDDEARLAGVPELAPTLVRYAAPPGAPPHLSVTLRRLEVVRRSETLLVVAPDAAPEALLERVSDVRRRGATILSLDGGDSDLHGLADDVLAVPAAPLPEVGGFGAVVSFESVQHLVSLAAGEESGGGRRPGVRDRLARFLDAVSGPPPDRR